MTDDTQKLRELGHTLNGMLLPDGYNRSALKSAAAALPALLDEIERLTQQNAGLMEQHGRDSQELRRLCEDRDQARRTAQYWKDQHLAGNAEIERKDAEVARLECNRDMWKGQCERQAKQLEATRWQPIQTAPHGQEVLLGWTDWDGAWITEVAMATWGWRTERVSNMSSHGRATHWMPLPPAPGAALSHSQADPTGVSA